MAALAFAPSRLAAVLLLLLIRGGLADDWLLNSTATAVFPGAVPGETATAGSDVEMLPSSYTDAASAGHMADGEASMFAYHKELWPLNGADCFTLLFAAAGLVIAAGGGIGGGGILVPLFIVFLKFRPKHAIALSNFATLGGAIANTVFNVQKTDEYGLSLIDWDIIVMMEPSTIAGAVIGSFASKYLPDILLTISLTVVLALLAYRTLDKGVKMFQRESEDERPSGHGRLNTEEDDDLNEPNSDDGEEELIHDYESAGLMGGGESGSLFDKATPWKKVSLLTACFAGCIVLTVLKGSGHGSIIGVECGSFSFWLISLAVIPWVTLFGARFRKILINENEVRRRTGCQLDDSVVRWDAKTTVQYPLICTFAGIFAGLFGVGGGIVKGPLMLEMGVKPLVAAATAATMILFTTTAACVSFEIFGLLEPSYGFACFVLGLVCTAVGQGAVNAWMGSARRQSPPVLSIGLVMALSTALVALEVWEKLTSETWGELMSPESVCSRSG